MIVGRGSFTESFPLFGYELKDYDRSFEEKLDLFAAPVRQQPVTWRGTVRPPLSGQRVFPPVQSTTVRTWVGLGGAPQLVLRAVRYGFPLMIASAARIRPAFALSSTCISADLRKRKRQQLSWPAGGFGIKPSAERL